MKEEENGPTVAFSHLSFHDPFGTHQLECHSFTKIGDMLSLLYGLPPPPELCISVSSSVSLSIINTSSVISPQRWGSHKVHPRLCSCRNCFSCKTWREKAKSYGKDMSFSHRFPSRFCRGIFIEKLSLYLLFSWDGFQVNPFALRGGWFFLGADEA